MYLTKHIKQRAIENHVDLEKVLNVSVPNVKTATEIERRPNSSIYVITMYEPKIKDIVVITVVEFKRTPTKEHLNVEFVQRMK